MNDLEYTSLLIDLFLGFICCLLWLLHYLGVEQYFEKVTGIIWIAPEAIGFILTIIYVGYSGYIFDNHPSDYETYLLYPNGARFEVKDGKLVPPYDEEKYKKNTELIYAKYNDLGKKDIIMILIYIKIKKTLILNIINANIQIIKMSFSLHLLHNIMVIIVNMFGTMEIFMKIKVINTCLIDG